MADDHINGHTIYIYDRGGVTRFGNGQLMEVSQVRWTRVRDDISEGSVVIDGSLGSGQAPFLASIEPGRHEMVIYRGQKRVWEGPITRITYTRTTVEIFARDVMHYASRTIMKAKYSSAFPNVEYGTSRAKRIMMAEMARHEALSPPINVLPYLQEHHVESGAKTTQVTMPYQFTVFEHVDSMAARGGIDYTVIGRAIHLWDVDQSLGLTATVTEADFLGDVKVSVYGMELATFSGVTDGQGNFGTAGGAHPYYGLVETLATAYDETEGATQATPAEMASQARFNLSARSPTPVQVRIPDNSSLNPNGILTVDDLVPGVHIPMLATMTARTVSQMQKLNSVTFTETSAGETITVVLFPAAQTDVPPEEP